MIDAHANRLEAKRKVPGYIPNVRVPIPTTTIRKEPPEHGTQAHGLLKFPSTITFTQPIF